MYGLAAIFALVATFSIISIVCKRGAIFKKRKGHFAVMLSALAVAGFLRSIVLLWDPYVYRVITLPIHRFYFA